MPSVESVARVEEGRVCGLGRGWEGGMRRVSFVVVVAVLVALAVVGEGARSARLRVRRYVRLSCILYGSQLRGADGYAEDGGKLMVMAWHGRFSKLGL